MSENDKIEELQQSIKELEETILQAITDAENGNEQVAQKLNELKGDVIVSCRSDVILRLAEFYCLSIETAGKAFQICEWMLDNNRWDLSDITNIYMLSAAIPTAKDDLEKTNPLVIKGRATIKTCAENGYALGQYWMGRLAEDGNDYTLAAGFERKEHALAWYRQAADQGLVVAQKRLAEFSAQAKRLGYCSHCWGSFKGLFKKTCRKCGRPKDY
ncbi:MAG: hypothetical protein IKM08_08980 [Clostridia bacterium]|nr:hypothetical protein [Clostridia bacterium]